VITQFVPENASRKIKHQHSLMHIILFLSQNIIQTTEREQKGTQKIGVNAGEQDLEGYINIYNPLIM
jgi:hypothetical protein